MSFDIHPEDKEHIYREECATHIVKVKIPDGSIKCPDCHGSGRFRYRFSENPYSVVNDFMDCILCEGKGFVEISYLQKFHPEKLKKVSGVLGEKP